MSPTSSTQAWLEAASGARYSVPEGAASPINVGRVATPGAAQDGIGIPQSEQTRFISRKHATLWRLDDGTWQVSDAGSASGLWVNGVKATGDTRFPLTEGTKLKLGNYELTFHVIEAVADAGGHGGEDGGTMVLRDFAPSAAPAAPAAAFNASPEDKRFLDTRGGNEAIEIEIPLKPGVGQWTVGRALKAEGNDPSVDHVSVPNLPEFNSVSRRQVILSRGADGRWTVKNLSTQGSKLNDQPLSSDAPTPIKAGDKLVMGSRPFFFREGVIKPHYRDEDFAVSGAVLGGVAGDNPDLEDTREIVAGIHRGVQQDSEELPAWGELIENKLMGARSYPLRKRKTKIGSHPINCDIKLEDPGIDDLYATIEWHGKDCKIHSKSHDSPVRVNHAAYRVSPPLTSGAILTLGNQEYHIEITGLPPEATSTLVVQRVRRLVIFGIFSIIAICGGTLYAAKMLTPGSQVATAEPKPESAAVIKDVLETRGLAGLSLLASLDSKGDLTPEQEAVLKKLREIDQIDYLVNKSPDREFRTSVETIDKDMADARNVFAMAGVNPSMADQGWFKQLQDSFHDRRGKSYVAEWTTLLTALRENNLANAERMLVSMTNTQPELLDQAKVAISRWSAISSAMRTRTQSQIIDGYMDGVRNQRTGPFLTQQRTELTQLVNMLAEIEKDPSETSDALMNSSQWKSYKDTLTMFDNTLKAIEAYQDASSDKFLAAYNELPDANKVRELKAMAASLDLWDKVQSSVSAAGGSASSKPELISALNEVRMQFQQLQDQNAPAMRAINSKMNSLQGQRGSQAASLRQEAASLPAGFDQINKLLDAFQFDPSSQAENDIDGKVVGLVGLIAKDNSAAQKAADLKKIQGRINLYIQQNLMHKDYMTSVNQIDTLLQRAGVN